MAHAETAHLPNLQEMAPAAAPSDAQAIVEIQLQPGWIINEEAPSFLALLSMDNDALKPIARFEREAIQPLAIRLPKLENGQRYRLQGTLYYCQDKEGSQCLTKSFDVEINPRVTLGAQAPKVRLMLN